MFFLTKLKGYDIMVPLFHFQSLNSMPRGLRGAFLMVRAGQDSTQNCNVSLPNIINPFWHPGVILLRLCSGLCTYKNWLNFPKNSQSCFQWGICIMKFGMWHKDGFNLRNVAVLPQSIDRRLTELSRNDISTWRINMKLESNLEVHILSGFV